jgi:hypothetical protein
MARRVFTSCLNQEPKAFNSPIGGIACGGVLLVLFGVGKGLMWGMGGGVAGYTIGSWLSKQWFLGQIQRKLYWYLPGQKLFIDKNIPESHHRKLM